MSSKAGPSSAPMQKQGETLCTNPKCPSLHAHESGVYNLNTFANEATRRKPIPKDLRGVLYRLNNTSFNRTEDYEFLAKFAVAHQSHRGGFLPLDITKRIFWTNNPKIVEILGLWSNPKMARPLTASAYSPMIKKAKPVATEVTMAPMARETPSSKVPVKKEEVKPVAGENSNRFAMLAENEEEEEEEQMPPSPK